MLPLWDEHSACQEKKLNKLKLPIEKEGTDIPKGYLQPLNRHMCCNKCLFSSQNNAAAQGLSYGAILHLFEKWLLLDSWKNAKYCFLQGFHKCHLFEMSSDHWKKLITKGTSTYWKWKPFYLQGILQPLNTQSCWQRLLLSSRFTFTSSSLCFFCQIWFPSRITILQPKVSIYLVSKRNACFNV